MSTATRTSPIYVITIANHLLDRTRAYLDAINHYEEGQSLRIVDDTFLARYGASIEALDTSGGAQHASLTNRLGSTAREEAARTALREAIVAIRDKVKTYFPNDDRLQRSFGKRLALSNSTPALLDASAAIRAAWGEEENHAPAVSIGIDQAKLDALAKLRKKLSRMNTAGNAARVKSKTKTVIKLMTLDELKAANQQLRGLAKLVFVGQPEIVAEFTSRPPGSARRRRAKGVAAPVSKPVQQPVLTPASGTAPAVAATTTPTTGEAAVAIPATNLASAKPAEVVAAPQPTKRRRASRSSATALANRRRNVSVTDVAATTRWVEAAPVDAPTPAPTRKARTTTGAASKAPAAPKAPAKRSLESEIRSATEAHGKRGKNGVAAKNGVKETTR